MRVYNSWGNVIGWSGDSIRVPEGKKLVTLEEEEKEEEDLDGSHGREIYKSNFKQKKTAMKNHQTCFLW